MPTIEIGAVLSTTRSGELTVIALPRSYRAVVRFNLTGYEKTCRVEDLLAGKVSDPMYPRIFGIGYLGVGDYGSSKHHTLYQLWYNMLKRAKADGVHVTARWRNFQLFAKDVDGQAALSKKRIGVRLLKGKRTYGPTTALIKQI